MKKLAVAVFTTLLFVGCYEPAQLGTDSTGEEANETERADAGSYDTGTAQDETNTNDPGPDAESSEDAFASNDTGSRDTGSSRDTESPPSDTGSTTDTGSSQDTGSDDTGGQDTGSNDTGSSQDTGSQDSGPTLAQRLANCQANVANANNIALGDIESYAGGNDYYHDPPEADEDVTYGNTLEVRNPNVQPTSDHYLKGYDEGLVLKEIGRAYDPGEEFTVALLVKATAPTNVVLGYEQYRGIDLDPAPQGPQVSFTIDSQWTCLITSFEQGNYRWRRSAPHIIPDGEQLAFYYGQLPSGEMLEIAGGAIGSSDPDAGDGNDCQGQPNGSACQLPSGEVSVCQQEVCVRCSNGLWFHDRCEGCTSDSFCESDEYCEMNPSPPNPINPNVGTCQPQQPSCQTQVWYKDDNGDGYGNPYDTTTACTQPADYVAQALCDNDADGTQESGELLCTIDADNDGTDERLCFSDNLFEGGLVHQTTDACIVGYRMGYTFDYLNGYNASDCAAVSPADRYFCVDFSTKSYGTTDLTLISHENGQDDWWRNDRICDAFQLDGSAEESFAEDWCTGSVGNFMIAVEWGAGGVAGNGDISIP
jgi:hypothetical protein